MSFLKIKIVSVNALFFTVVLILLSELSRVLWGHWTGLGFSFLEVNRSDNVHDTCVKFQF